MAILDSVTNEKVAYSLRLLRSAYAGPAVNIRRDVDNVPADIGFDGSGDFDVAGYTTHLEGSTPDSTVGFTTRFYDQSGSGLDLVQATAGEQPKILLSSFGWNSVATIDFVGSRFFRGPDISALTAAEMFVVWQTGSDGTNNGPWRWGSDAGGSRASHYTFTDGNIYDDFGSTVRKATGNPTPDVTLDHIYNVITASGEWTSNINDSEHHTTETNTVGWDTTPFLGENDVSNFFENDIAEFIIFDAKLSGADHDAVFSDLDGYYITQPAAGTIPHNPLGHPVAGPFGGPIG